MGRLPLQFAGRDITFRVPYSIYSELTVESEETGIVFPEGSFLHNVNKPFEIHRMGVRLTGFAETDDETPVTYVPDPQPTTLEKLVSLRVVDVAKNENITKNKTRVDSILQFNTGFWEWEEPYTLVQSEQLQVQVDADALPTICSSVFSDGETPECVATPVTITSVRVQINYQGFLVVIAAPTENR